MLLRQANSFGTGKRLFSQLALLSPLTTQQIFAPSLLVPMANVLSSSLLLTQVLLQLLVVSLLVTSPITSLDHSRNLA